MFILQIRGWLCILGSNWSIVSFTLSSAKVIQRPFPDFYWTEPRKSNLFDQFQLKVQLSYLRKRKTQRTSAFHKNDAIASGIMTSCDSELQSCLPSPWECCELLKSQQTGKQINFGLHNEKRLTWCWKSGLHSASWNLRASYDMFKLSPECPLALEQLPMTTRCWMPDAMLQPWRGLQNSFAQQTLVPVERVSIDLSLLN